MVVNVVVGVYFADSSGNPCQEVTPTLKTPHEVEFSREGMRATSTENEESPVSSEPKETLFKARSLSSESVQATTKVS